MKNYFQAKVKYEKIMEMNKCVSCAHYCSSAMLPMCYANRLSIVRSSDAACKKYEPRQYGNR